MIEIATEYPEEELAREYRAQKLAFAQAKAALDTAHAELVRVGECVQLARDRLEYHCRTCHKSFVSVRSEGCTCFD